MAGRTIRSLRFAISSRGAGLILCVDTGGEVVVEEFAVGQIELVDLAASLEAVLEQIHTHTRQSDVGVVPITGDVWPLVEAAPAMPPCASAGAAPDHAPSNRRASA